MVGWVEEGDDEDCLGRIVDHRCACDPTRVDVSAWQRATGNGVSEMSPPEEGSVERVDGVDRVVLGGDDYGLPQDQWLSVGPSVQSRKRPPWRDRTNISKLLETRTSVVLVVGGPVAVVGHRRGRRRRRRGFEG